MWETSYEVDVKEIGCEDVKWIHLAQNRDPLTDCCNGPLGSIKGRMFLD
jgi:hypothetical protein